MFPSQSASSPLTPGDRSSRSSFPHSYSQPTMPFSASSSSSVGWGATATSTGSLNDPFTASRSHYQPGFLMSMTQNNTMPAGSQIIEEPPIIPTKFNPTASRTSPSEFGLESMFERTKSRRQRQSTSADDDAPPTASIMDTIDEPHMSPFQRRDIQFDSSRARPIAPSQQQGGASQIVYINVFGYPLDLFESVVRLFQGLGDTTEPEPSENGMWFTLGFRNPWEAERALRRNGKIMDEMYMIGVARANGTPAVDVFMDTSGPRIPGSPPTADIPAKDSLVPTFNMNRSTSFGVPLTLAPSTAAFKTPTNKPKSQASTTTTPIRVQPNEMAQGSTLSKISDMIFGW